jgi:hypothetical protein
VILVGIFCASFFTKQSESYDLDPMGVAGAFEPILGRYVRLAEFVVGLATGSIVLLVGSSAFHSQAGHLPWFYASPLLLLGYSVVYAISFMVWLVHNHEEVQHGNQHTRLAYSISETLGFSSLTCFCCGYLWLIVIVTR